MDRTPVNMDDLVLDTSKMFLRPALAAKNTVAKKAKSTKEKEARLLYLKECGLKEIAAFRNAVESFVKAMKDTVLFGGMAGHDDNFEVRWNAVIDYMFVPIINGETPQGMDDDSYQALRKEMFTQLAGKYGMNPKEMN